MNQLACQYARLYGCAESNIALPHMSVTPCNSTPPPFFPTHADLIDLGYGAGDENEEDDTDPDVLSDPLNSVNLLVRSGGAVQGRNTPCNPMMMRKVLTSVRLLRLMYS